MTFDIYLLDKLDYDEAEPLIEDYVNDLLQEFIESKAGKAHIKKHPQGGFWIGNFVEMAYFYGGYTPPKMTKGNVQELMEYILPRKLTLMNPSDTDGAIAELTAFWHYLDEKYKFRSAKAIAKYLQSIENKFPQWMFDPQRGGFAKQFIIQGTEAGFDMSTQEGVEAYQQEYNQTLAGGSPPAMLPEIPMSQAPADMIRAFELLGLELPPNGQMVNPVQLMQQFVEAMGNVDPGAAEELMEILETNVELPAATTADAEDDELDGPDADLFKLQLGGEKQLAEEQQDLLRSQSITATSPGTILQDLQAMVTFLQENAVTVSGKLKHFSLKWLADLNQQLSQPIAIALKRPQQMSYPHIHGLYLLLRTTGIAQVVAQGKQYYLAVNPDVYQSWQQLNPTEQYFSLLETWFLRSHPETLGEERSGPMVMGDRCLQAWSNFTAKKTHTFSSYAKQDSFFYYWPGIQNVALMELFGLLQLTSGKPESGKGWRIRKLEVLPFGKALMALLHNAYLDNDCQWAGTANLEHPLGEFQPALQPYFPEWQHSLKVPTHPFRSERHIFKVSLDKIWRRIAIAGDATLADFSSIILDSVDFDHDHFDQFIVEMPSGRRMEVVHPACLETPLFGAPRLATDEIKVGSVPLTIGSQMTYIFDFGDWWEFQVQLEALEPASEAPSEELAKVKGKKNRRSKASTAIGEILEARGPSPEQYSDEAGW